MHNKQTYAIQCNAYWDSWPIHGPKRGTMHNARQMLWIFDAAWFADIGNCVCSAHKYLDTQRASSYIRSTCWPEIWTARARVRSLQQTSLSCKLVAAWLQRSFMLHVLPVWSPNHRFNGSIACTPPTAWPVPHQVDSTRSKWWRQRGVCFIRCFTRQRPQRLRRSTRLNTKQQSTSSNEKLPP